MDKDLIRIQSDDEHYLFPEDRNGDSTIFECLVDRNEVHLQIRKSCLDIVDCFMFSEKIDRIRQKMENKCPYYGTWDFYIDLGRLRFIEPTFLKRLIDEMSTLRRVGVHAYCWNLISNQVRAKFQEFNYFDEFVLDGWAGLLVLPRPNVAHELGGQRRLVGDDRDVGLAPLADTPERVGQRGAGAFGVSARRTSPADRRTSAAECSARAEWAADW